MKRLFLAIDMRAMSIAISPVPGTVKAPDIMVKQGDAA
jgi:hypothetical protein